MGTKLNPGHYDCYENALPDEPMFILLARDPNAPGLITKWATDRARAIEDGNRPNSDLAMVEEAMNCANNMICWRKANDGKWRLDALATCKPANEGEGK